MEHFWCQFRQKGSKFWRCPAHSNKLLEGFALLTKIKKGVPTFGHILRQNFERVRIFGHMLTKTSRGFTFLARIRKRVRTFEYGLAERLGRVRTFGHGFGSNFKKFAFSDTFWKGFAFLYIFRLGRKWFAVFDHKRHKAKTLKIRRPFLLHSAFINPSRKCIFLVDRVVEHFWCKFW